MRLTKLALCAVVGLVLITGSGCRHFCRDILPGAIPQPVGTYVCQWQTEQMGRAESDDFMIYRYEWDRETNDFSPYGKRHMAIIAERLDHTPFPVVIEPSDNPELDHARHVAVLARLAERGTPIPPQRVIVGHSTDVAEGLYGQEAPAATARLFSNRRGNVSTFGFGGIGGLGGFRGGFGGGFGGGIRPF